MLRLHGPAHWGSAAAPRHGSAPTLLSKRWARLITCPAMIVIGIDPGTLHLGWGVLRSEGNRVTHLGHGVIDAPANQCLARRLVLIDGALEQIIDRYRP